MKSPKIGGRGRGFPHHETANRGRSSRAQEHLARARERDRRRLETRGRDRARSRIFGGNRAPRRGLLRAGSASLALALGLALAALLGEPVLGWLGPELGSVDTIAIQGNSRLTFVEVASATGVARGSELARVDAAVVEERLRAVPWIRDARVMRLPPSTLLVRISEREPRAILLGTGRGREVRLVDADGTPFAAGSASDPLPRIVGGDALENGVSHPVLATALDLLDDLETVGAGALADRNGEIALHLPYGDAPEGWVVKGAAEVVLGVDELDVRFARLARLLDANEIGPGNAKKMTRIDLRFADQAVLSPAKPDTRG
jgi:cell division septal protein FtsQ